MCGGVQAADVYSFGVLVWEMAAGQRMWASMNWPQAMAAATMRHARPRTPRQRCTPAGLESLARLCMAYDPENRPSFEEVRPWLPSTQMQHTCTARQACLNSYAPQEPLLDWYSRQPLSGLGWI